MTIRLTSSRKRTTAKRATIEAVVYGRIKTRYRPKILAQHVLIGLPLRHISAIVERFEVTSYDLVEVATERTATLVVEAPHATEYLDTM